MLFGQVHLVIILPPRIWASRRQTRTGKSAKHSGRVTRPWTVAPVHKLLLEAPNNTQHVTKVYVTFYGFYSSTSKPPILDNQDSLGQQNNFLSTENATYSYDVTTSCK